MRGGLAVLAAGLLLLLAPSAGADQVREREITDLLNQAVRDVYRAAPGCRPTDPFGGPTTFTDAAPSADLLSAFAVLRRSPTPQEQTLGKPRFPFPAQGLYRRQIRIATSASGRKLIVYAAQNVNRYEPRPERCSRALRRRYGERLRGRSAGFVRAARRALEQVIRDEWAGPKPEPAEGLFVLDFTGTGPGGGGGGVPVADIRRHGLFSSSQRGGGRRGRSPRSVVSGLVPDGVASITVRYGTQPVPAPDRPLKRYPQPIMRTIAVRENVVSFTVARAAQDALPRRMTWTASDGTARTIRQPF